MISLSTSAFYERATRQVGSLRSEAEKLQEEIGSGSRLSRSSDDPVAAARLRTLDRSVALAEIDQRNSDLAQNDLKLTDRALSTVADIVIRAQELATQAANETLSVDQRTAIGKEIGMLQDSLLLAANSRNGTGGALFGGQAAGVAYEMSGGVATYLGTASADAVDLGDGQQVVPALTGPEVFQIEVDGVSTDLFQVLGNLSASLQGAGAQNGDSAREALGGLKTGLEKVTTAQTIVGGRMGWIELMDERRVATGQLVADEQSAIGGADIATTVTRLQEITTILEASQASFVRLSQLTLFDMIR